MNAMLPPLVQRFVLHFGEMGSRWGINRTVGQIYALLFVSPRPLNADEIAEGLAFSRSNVSMGLKELQSWRLVKLQHLPGDRREYFSAPEDVWAIFQTLAEERRKREVDPTLSMLRDALLEAPTDPAEQHAQQRMREMHDLIELTTGWFEEVRAHKGVDAAHVYGGLMATLQAWSEDKGVPCAGVPVGVIKKFATGKGNANKEAMMAAMRELGFDVVDDNHADAIALWLCQAA